jgi:hypothetical protein
MPREEYVELEADIKSTFIILRNWIQLYRFSASLHQICGIESCTGRFCEECLKIGNGAVPGCI